MQGFKTLIEKNKLLQQVLYLKWMFSWKLLLTIGLQSFVGLVDSFSSLSNTQNTYNVLFRIAAESLERGVLLTDLAYCIPW